VIKINSVVVSGEPIPVCNPPRTRGGAYTPQLAAPSRNPTFAQLASGLDFLPFDSLHLRQPAVISANDLGSV